jgi:hypothetical protein
MRYVVSTIAVCCFLLATNAAQDDPSKKDLDSLQGVWQCVSIEFPSDAPAPPDPDLAKKMKLTIKGKTRIISSPGKGLSQKHQLAMKSNLFPKINYC